MNKLTHAWTCGMQAYCKLYDKALRPIYSCWSFKVFETLPCERFELWRWNLNRLFIPLLDIVSKTILISPNLWQCDVKRGGEGVTKEVIYLNDWSMGTISYQQGLYFQIMEEKIFNIYIKVKKKKIGWLTNMFFRSWIIVRVLAGLPSKLTSIINHCLYTTVQNILKIFFE